MGLGHHGEHQGKLFLTFDVIPRSCRHAFYDRLQQTLRQFRFNAFVAKLCQPYYADKGRPSIRKRDRCVILSSSRLALFPGLRGGSRGGFFSSSRMCSPRWRQLPAKGDTSAPQVTRRTAFFRLKAMVLRRNASSTLGTPKYLVRQNP